MIGSRSALGLLSGVCLLAMPAVLNAQPVSNIPEGAGADGPAGEADIVVTGSRLVVNGNKAPTPVTVVTSTELVQRAPSNLSDALNQLPQFQGSNTPASNGAGNPSSITTDNNLNLRFLGPVRVLTLFDGKRLPPSSGSGLVNANMVPQLLVQRVDVVTGGASAAYGSDAVSGVVNFVLNRKFEGVTYVAQGGISQRSDYESVRLGAAFGKTLLDGRLHVLASAEYYKNKGIDALDDRALGSLNYVTVGKNGGVGGTVANPFVTVANARSTSIGFGGYFLSGPFANNQILPNGTLVPFQGQVVGSGVCVQCNTASHDPSTISLVPSLQTDQYFARADYDLTDDVGLNLQGIYAHSYSAFNGSTTVTRAGSATQFTIFRENAFLPAALAAQIPAAGVGFARQSRDLGTQTGQNDSKTWQVSGGLSGSFGKAWVWDAGYSYGRSEQLLTIGQLNNVNLRAALDAVRDPATGNIVCRVTLTNPGLYPGCTPINLFGEGSASPAALAYVQGTARQKSVNTQTSFSANLRGELFDLWAGPVAIAVGGEYRRQTLRQTSNADPSNPPTGAGIRGFTGLQYTVANLGTAAGSVKVKEGYAEVQVPLAKDLPFARSLDLNGAVRFTDYSTSGGVKTWKLGGNWEPTEGLRFRVTRSRDVRAPTLFELYAGTQIATPQLIDPHTGLSQLVRQITAGNAALQPEKANTFTAGLVAQPSFLRGFSFSIDYYKIEIKDAIVQPYTPTQIVQICENSGGTDALCGQIVRPLPFSDRSAANYPTSISLIPLNATSLKTSGFDFESHYRTGFGPGTLSLRLLMTYLQKYDQQQVANAPITHLAGNSDINLLAGGLPKYRGTASVDYAVGRFGIYGQARYVGRSVRSKQIIFEDNRQPSRIYTDLNLTYNLLRDNQAQLFVNVTNLLDTKPPLAAPTTNPGSTYPVLRGLYDVIGRRFTVGVRGKF